MLVVGKIMQQVEKVLWVGGPERVDADVVTGGVVWSIDAVVDKGREILLLISLAVDT